MRHRYIILVGGRSSVEAMLPPLINSPSAAGMACKLDSGTAKVFVAADVPTLAIPGHGLIIGEVFTKDGQRICQRLEIGGTTRDVADHLVQHLWGHYLAVLVDHRDNAAITLLRDPSGAVPCVHSLNDGKGFITSDIDLAVELGLYRREVDWQAVAHSLNFPYLRPVRTALKHVNELLPGSALTCRGSSASNRSVWSPWRFVERGARHEDPCTAAQDVYGAVSGVVDSLSAGEDKFLVELSGGLDSSIVATCLRNVSRRAIFCTLVMPVTGTDERPYARMVTDALGQELEPVEIGFDNVRLEFPVPRSSVTPAIGMLQNAVNEAWGRTADHYGVESFFSGGGGDTVFGYLKTAAPAADAFIERCFKGGMTAIGDLAALHRCTVFEAGRLALRKLRQRQRIGWKEDTTLLNLDCAVSESEHHPWMDVPPNALPGDREKIFDLIGTQLFRMGTPRGEGRTMHFPLLSQPVMEACLRVPTWMWVADGRNRAVAREAFADHLPRGILDRRSKGSYTGYMAAVYSRNKLQMREFLEEGLLCAHDLLDRTALANFFARELAPRDLSFLRIVDLCAAENWARQQNQRPSSAPALR